MWPCSSGPTTSSGRRWGFSEPSWGSDNPPDALHEPAVLSYNPEFFSLELLRLNLTRKKKTLHAPERDRPENQAKRQAFRATVAEIDPHRLVFVDETGTNTAMTRTYGRAPRGARVVGTVAGQWTTVTLISALRLSGVVAPLAFEGATDTLAFQTYVEPVLTPQLQPGDVVIWDNLKPHQDAEVKQLIETAGAELVPLPPYSSGDFLDGSGHARTV